MRDTIQNGHLRFSPEVLKYIRTRWKRNSRGAFWSLRDAIAQHDIVFPEDKLSRSQLLNYEKGKSTPGSNMLAKLAELYDVPPGIFFTRVVELSDEQARDVLVKAGLIPL